MVGVAAVLAAGPPVAPGQETPACSDTVIAGRVSHGEAFEAPLSSGLTFRLHPAAQPPNPQGWTVQVTPAVSHNRDFSWVATPPYRFSNPRYLDTGYGITARVALSWTPRAFRYVATEQDYEAASSAVSVLLWSAGQTEEEIAAARATLDAIPTYPGRLWIVDGSTSAPDSEHPGGLIRWVEFRVELCLPGQPPPEAAGREMEGDSPQQGEA